MLFGVPGGEVELSRGYLVEGQLQRKLMEFSDSVGVELSDLLERRASEQLSEQSDFDRLTATLGAALVVVAQVLRAPAAKAQDVEPLIEFTSRWLRTLLKPVTDKDKTQS